MEAANKERPSVGNRKVFVRNRQTKVAELLMKPLYTKRREILDVCNDPKSLSVMQNDKKLVFGSYTSAQINNEGELEVWPKKVHDINSEELMRVSCPLN